MHSYYAARALEYDGIYLKPERQADLRAIEAWLPFRFARASVLEVACGTGYWTQFIASVAESILAIDAAPETLAIAKSRVAQEKVKFVVGDAYDLPPHPEKFDAAFAGFWFSHVPKQRQQAFLAGLHALLRPGARVVLLDNRYVEGSSSPISEHDDSGNTYQTRKLADGSTHRVLKNFPAGQELKALVAESGRNAKLNCWQYYWAFEYLVAPY
jgi:demethylmenaquinone methyltransferase/2-methoxy-6-polyprenyl-1,4-benzoquinol methylase